MARILILGSVAESLISFRGPMLEKMVGCGHQVFASTPEAPEEIRNKLLDIGVIFRKIELDRTGMNLMRDFRSLICLFRLCASIRPDIVMAYTSKPVIYGSIAAQLSGVPKIYSMISGLGYAFSNAGVKSKIIGVFVRRLYRFALSSNHKVFFQNPDNLKLFVESGLVNGHSKAVLINGSGVDIDIFRPAAMPESLSFLLVARLIRDKGVYEYIEAAKIIKDRHPEVKFRLVGFIDKNPSAIAEEDLKSWVEEGTVEFLGYLRDVRPALEACSVYVLPSFYPEGTPHSVLEAMAMGRPVITTDTPGCRETVIGGENGFLIPVKNVQKLVDAIEHFVNRPSDIVSMGQASRRIAEEKYDVNKVNALIFHTMGLS